MMLLMLLMLLMHDWVVIDSKRRQLAKNEHAIQYFDFSLLRTPAFQMMMYISYFPSMLFFGILFFDIVIPSLAKSPSITLSTHHDYRYATHIIPFIRGGNIPFDDYDEDDYDEQEYDEYNYDPSPPQPPPRRRGSPPPHQRRGPPRQRQPPKPSLVDKTAKLAKQSLNLATSATMTSLKGSGKAAYYLASPKHVSRSEICGIWRFDQVLHSMGGGESDTVACAANIELTLRGDALVTFEGETDESIYHFFDRKWPQSCTIEFEAKAFQGPEDERPIRYWYKGYFRRKLADKSVIKIVGTIYECERTRFGKGHKRGQEVGSFVARKRIQRKRVIEDEEYDVYGDGDYEEYDEGEYDDEDAYSENEY